MLLLVYYTPRLLLLTAKAIQEFLLCEKRFYGKIRGEVKENPSENFFTRIGVTKLLFL